MNLKWLIDIFEDNKEKEAIIWRNNTYTYKWLYEKYSEWVDTLKKNQIKPGEVVAVSADYSPHVSTLLLALINNDNIIVPLSSASEHNKKEFIEIANAEIVFEFNELGEWFVSRIGNKVEAELILKLVDSGKPGLILFSSGSTGKSKGVVHDFSKLMEKYKRKQKTLRTLVFLLIDHIGGINTLFYILANAGTMVIEESKHPSNICASIEKYKVELLPTSPTFLNLILISEEYKNYNLSSLKIISYGTEPMQEYTLSKLNEIFPGVTLKQTYGLSELGIMSTKSEDSNSLWMKLGGDGFETKIVDNILWIKSDTSMLGYLNAPDPFDEEGWFNTQDMVLQKGEYVKILGRTSELINVGGQKVYPAEVESVLLEIENIKDVIVYSEKNPLLGSIVCAKVNIIEDEPLVSLKKRIRQYCHQKLEEYKIPVKIQIENNFFYSERYKRIRKNDNLV